MKRVKDVVRVFARIRRALPATLLMIGDGPERDDAEKEARELSVDDGRALPRPARFGGRAAAEDRPLRAAHPERVVRPGRARGDGLRRAGGRLACRRTARGGGRRRERDPRAARLGGGDGPPRGGAAARSGASRGDVARRPSRGHGCSTPTASCRCTSRSTAKSLDDAVLVARADPWTGAGPHRIPSDLELRPPGAGRAPGRVSSRRACSSRWWCISPRCSRWSWPTGPASWSCCAGWLPATAGVVALRGAAAARLDPGGAGRDTPQGLLRPHLSLDVRAGVAVPGHRGAAVEHALRAAPRAPASG